MGWDWGELSRGGGLEWDGLGERSGGAGGHIQGGNGMGPGWSWGSHPGLGLMWGSGYPQAPASPPPSPCAQGGRQRSPARAVLGPARPGELCRATSRSALPSPAACLASRSTPGPHPRHPPPRAPRPAAAPRSSAPQLHSPLPTLGGKPGLKSHGRIPPPFPSTARCPPGGPAPPDPPLPGSPVTRGASAWRCWRRGAGLGRSPGTCACTHLLPGLI